MKKNENRRQFLQKAGLISLAAGTVGSLFPLRSFGGTRSLIPDENRKLVSLSPSALFRVLDMNLPELASVKKALDKKDSAAALAELLNYYRMRYPKVADGGTSRAGSERSIARADDLAKHIFQWGPYPSASYGENMDWAADPAGDIEWVAGLYRFSWLGDITNAYKATGDERYGQLFVDLTTDWIKKHPLEKTVEIMHPVYGWKGYPWLDLQTGIRATNICSNFRTMVHARSFTPQFLGILLASLHDHQVKTEVMPMARIHNKAIFEQRGFFNVLHTFPEFKDKKRWLDLAIGITSSNLLAQTSTDGVQREWCGGYHLGVYRDALEIDGRVKDMGLSMPDFYRNRVKAMADHMFAYSTPELSFPMFGDTSRAKKRSEDRKTWHLYNTLVEAGEKFGDPKFKALADLDIKNLPANGSHAFSDAGLYALRSNWTPDQVYMALHCSPQGISSHDTPDNGTFELYAYGRWLMPDTGFYTYGHDKEARTWHRQTKVHPTMTVNSVDSNIAGRELFWQSNEDQDVLSVENQSYPFFLHRRTIWFAGKKSETPFFVIVDEAIGDSKGDVAIHFPMAPGSVTVGSNTIDTVFDDANLHIQIAASLPVSLQQEAGWHAWGYGQREARTMVSAVHKGQAPLTFISILVPYKGKTKPSSRLLTDPASFIAGIDPLQLEVEVAGRKHVLSRNA